MLFVKRTFWKCHQSSVTENFVVKTKYCTNIFETMFNLLKVKLSKIWSDPKSRFVIVIECAKIYFTSAIFAKFDRHGFTEVRTLFPDRADALEKSPRSVRMYIPRGTVKVKLWLAVAGCQLICDWWLPSLRSISGAFFPSLHSDHAAEGRRKISSLPGSSRLIHMQQSFVMFHPCTVTKEKEV